MTPTGKATNLFGGASIHAQSQLKIPKEAVFASEEAEALLVESDCPQRKTTLQVHRSLWMFSNETYENNQKKKTNGFE
ncbi:hypothetical protein ACLIBG_03065 [Virgibacillus sp. W0181]|uniref:hypothetical protein n=1 Tax=Virgibacillus sp. W0181 TaxID=3391581 RepID=UPI003F448C52